MATIDSVVLQKRGGRTGEHLFFLGMSLVLAVVVFVGFSRTYYLAGYFAAKPLPAPIVHVHGAVFTSWLALLVIQASLVETGHTSIHRRLGLVGLVLAPLVFLLGVLVAVEMLNRTSSIPGFNSPVIFGVALGEITGFALPVFVAFRLRRNAAAHKRLVLIGTIAMMTAGFGRWPIRFLLHRPLPAMLPTFGLLGVVVAYDAISRGRIHRATAWGSAWVVVCALGGFAIGHTAAWRMFTTHVRALTG